MGKDSPTIEVIARGVTVHNGAVMVCQSIAGGYCYLPGGHVEFGEPAADALVREFLEETGLAVRVGGLLCFTEEVFHQKGRLRHEVNLLFHVELPTPGQTVPSLESHIAFRWLPRAEVEHANLLPPSAVQLCRAWIDHGPGADVPRLSRSER
jgi:8-oxo-dGTP diphosphatase